MRMDLPVGIKDSQTSKKSARTPESIAPSGSDTVWVIGSILMQACHELSSCLMLSSKESTLSLAIQNLIDISSTKREYI